MKKSILFCAITSTFSAHAADPYIEVGIGIPLSPHTGYYTDSYGKIEIGITHQFDDTVTIETGFMHQSMTGEDGKYSVCANSENDCRGDNMIETRIRYTF